MEQRHFDLELLGLKEKLLLMASKVEYLINQSIDSLIKKNAALAQSLFALDKEVDKLEIEIEEDANG
jgi:phosphate uptake regulator